MKENKEYKVDARVINLKKECVWIISKWKWIVALTLLCTICIVAWRYAVDYRSNQVAYEEAIQKQETSSVEYLAEQMTDEQMVKINRAYSCWLQSVGASEYLEHSILIRENPYEMNIAYVYIEFENEDRNTVRKYVHSQAFFEELQEILGWDTEECYLRELITDGSETTEYAFSVTAADPSDCEALAQALLDLTVKNCSESVKGGYYIPDIATDLDLVEKYNQVYENWEINSDRMKLYETLFSVSELAVLKAMMLDYLGISEISEDENTEIVLEKTTLNKKMIVIGGIAGIIFSVAFLIIFYTLSPYIHGKEELFTLFHLVTLGEIGAKSKNIEYLAANIVLACERNAADSVYVCGERANEMTPEVYDQIEEAIRSSHIKLTRGGDVTKSAKSLTEMVQIGNCILVEKDERSKCTTIAEEMNICSQNQVQVLGVIVLKP